MSEKELDVEEQKRKTRRKLLKLAVYGIPAISTILAAGKANAEDAVDAYYDEFEVDEADDEGGSESEDNRAGTGIKTKRHKPNGRKKYKRGLS